MYDNLLMYAERYKFFLQSLEKRISEKEFEKRLLEMQKIDLNHYTKIITAQELKKYILEYKNKDLKENTFKKLQIALPGNPEIVFKVCLEAIRYNVNMLICIEDFCLAQNTFIVEVINDVISNCKLKNKIELKNLLKDEEIINNSKYVDRTISIGNSNLYNRLEGKIDNLELNSYGILEVYTDSEEFEELKRVIYEYSIQNQFELEFYDDLEFEDAVNAINRDGYKFCSLLITEDEEKKKIFKNIISSKYVVLNKNPFNEINFSLEII